MPNAKFLIKGHARNDLAQIRKYTIENWGEAQWLVYKEYIFQNLQNLANNPTIGNCINELSENAFSFPLKDHIIYYLLNKNKIIIVGIISTNLAPEKHLIRKNLLGK